MSPKKSTSKKSATTSARSTTSKKVASKKSASKKAAAAPKKKSTAGATKPDEMPPDVLEFIQAIDDYKRKENRPFPSWSEILEIVKSLGYERSAS